MCVAEKRCSQCRFSTGLPTPMLLLCIQHRQSCSWLCHFSCQVQSLPSCYVCCWVCLALRAGSPLRQFCLRNLLDRGLDYVPLHRFCSSTTDCINAFSLTVVMMSTGMTCKYSCNRDAISWQMFCIAWHLSSCGCAD